ncbi:unnamed protein product, partial [Rotaria sp. Silwood1]
GQGWSASSGLVGGAGLVAGGEVIDSGLALGGAYGASGYALGGVGGWNSSLVAGGLGAGYGVGYGGLLGQSAVVSGADAAFLNADTDYNGSLDRDEFRNLLAQNL